MFRSTAVVVLCVVVLVVTVGSVVARPGATVAATVLGALAGLVLGVAWFVLRARRGGARSVGVGTVVGSLPSALRPGRPARRSTGRASPETSQARLRGPGRLMVLVVLLGVLLALPFLLFSSSWDLESPDPSVGPNLDVWEPAPYVADVTVSTAGRWSVDERIEVRLTKALSVPPASSGRWRYAGRAQGRPRVAVYRRARSRALDEPSVPFVTAVNVLNMPQVSFPIAAVRPPPELRIDPGRLTAGKIARRKVFYPGAKSEVRFVVPDAMIARTTPAAASRTQQARGHERVVIRPMDDAAIDDLPEAIEVEVRSQLARSSPFRWVVGKVSWALGLIAAGVIAFLVDRQLKRRIGDGSEEQEPEPQPSAGPA